MKKIVFPAIRPSRTKIVATLGPASDSDTVVADLINAGVDVFRLNMAHGGPAQGQARMDRIIRVRDKLSQPIAVLADLAGPKMRLGELPNNEYHCEVSTPIRIVRGKKTTEPNTFTTTYEPLVDELVVGNRIMLADGTVALQVVEKNKDDVLCEVVQSGTVRSRQGVNLPGAKLSVKTLQPEDLENAKWATQAGVDFLGLSFVRNADDIHELRDVILAAAGGNRETIPHIIAKIEKPEAVDNLDSIVDAADGVMVARGDLGVEVDIAQIAVVQKRIIQMCLRKNKPVIVATQMLESMHHLTLPTRAEATDVANAVLDGADACMLSGETAVGEHPVLAVEMMHRIAVEAEKVGRRQVIEAKGFSLESCICQKGAKNTLTMTECIAEAVGTAAVQLAEDIDAALILITSHSGRTALGISGKRRQTLAIGMSHSQAALRRMNLYWGVIPILNAPDTTNEKLRAIESAGKAAGYLKTGDRIVFVRGLNPREMAQNDLFVHLVR